VTGKRGQVPASKSQPGFRSAIAAYPSAGLFLTVESLIAAIKIKHASRHLSFADTKWRGLDRQQSKDFLSHGAVAHVS
jgi:hypothetical protein